MTIAAPSVEIPAPELKPRAQSKPGLRFMEAFTWIFESPKWLPQTALAAIFLNLPLFPLPIIGQIVMMGYLFNCLEDELRQPRFGYADFEWNKFSQYLMRGVFPWVINFVISLVGVAIALMFFFPMLMAGVTLVNTRDEMWMILGGVVIGVAYIIYIGFLLLVTVSPIPLMLRVGLSKNIKDAFEIRWAISFFRKLLPELLLTGFVLYLAIVPLGFLGLLACFFGLWFVTAWLYFVGFRLLLQLYLIFLARGGEPIPLPPLSSQPAATSLLTKQEIGSPFMPATG